MTGAAPAVAKRVSAKRPNPLASCMKLHHFALSYEEQREQLVRRLQAAREMTPTTYKKLPTSEQAEFDRERVRLALSPVVADRSEIRLLRRRINELLIQAELGGGSCMGGVVVTGPGGSGKSTALSLIAREVYQREQNRFNPDIWRKVDPSLIRLETTSWMGVCTAQFVPVVVLTLAGGMGPRVLTGKILKSVGSIGVPVAALETNARGADFIEQLASLMERFGTVLLVVDEIHFIRDTGQGAETINTIKDLMNQSNIVMLFAGVNDKSGKLRFLDGARTEVQQQLTRRFHRIKMGALTDPRESDDLKQLLKALAWKIVLLEQGQSWWNDEELVSYVYVRTQGVMEHVVRLFNAAALAAIGGGERIDITFLDDLHVSSEADQEAAGKLFGPLAGGTRRTARQHGGGAGLIVGGADD